MLAQILKLGYKGGNADASCYPDLEGGRDSKIKLSPWPFTMADWPIFIEDARVEV